MPAVDAANKRLDTDTFRLQFAGDSGVAAGIVNAITFFATSTNLVAGGAIDFFSILRANGTTASAKDAFAFSGLTATTAELEWTHADGSSVVLLATVHATWIEFEITSLTLTARTDNVAARIASDSFSLPTTQSGGSPVALAYTAAYLKHAGNAIAFGIVNDDGPDWRSYQSGGMYCALNGEVQNEATAGDTAAEMIGRKFAVFVCQNSPLATRAVYDSIAAGLGYVMSSRLAQQREYWKASIFITDWNATNATVMGGGTPGVTYNTARGNQIAAAAKAVGARRVWLMDQAWRDHTAANPFTPAAGVADAITAIKAAGLEVAAHCNPYLWLTTGGTGYEAVGDFKELTGGYTGYSTIQHWGDGATMPNDILEAIEDDLAAGYAAAGFNAGIYLDSLEAPDNDLVTPTNFAFGSSSAQWYLLARAPQIAIAAGCGPILGQSGHSGAAFLHAARVHTRDYLATTEANTKIIDQDIFATWHNWGKWFGAVADIGWWNLKVGGNWRTGPMLEHSRRIATALLGGINYQGTLAEFQTAQATGGLTIKAARPPRSAAANVALGMPVGIPR